MQAYLTYPVYTGILAITLIVFVPRRNIHNLAIYGITFGAIGDFLAILIFTHLLGVGGYINYGLFGFKGIPFFPLLAWAVWFILYFYFLPEQRLFKYIYISAAAGYAVLFSNVLANFNIFRWNYSQIIIPFFIYVSWFSASTWLKEKIDLKHIKE